VWYIKDPRRGSERNFTGTTTDDESVSIGTGEIDWKSGLKQAQRIGIQHYFIEDEAPDATSQVPESLRYLQAVMW
jgi:sugar phosphate isomerase/epimerase